jgi:WhiB family transcriptional regulator, redox-sensing transcriptional regulator
MTITDARWRDKAACRAADPDLFYPDTSADLARARAICRGCPVWARCLDGAFREGDAWGIRGGLTAYERRRLRERPAQPGRTTDPQPIRDLVGETVRILTATAATAERAAPMPPDPDAAVHRAVLLRELDAYEADRRARRDPPYRRLRAAPAPRPADAVPSGATLDLLRQGRREARQFRRAGLAVPPAAAALERGYWRAMRRLQARTGRRVTIAAEEYANAA